MPNVSLNSVDLPSPLPDSEIRYEPLVSLEEGKDNRIVISYTFPGFNFVKTKPYQKNGKELSFHQLNIPKTGFRAEAGKALLPSLGRFVQIPFNADFDRERDLQIEKFKTSEYEDIDVFPAQDLSEDQTGPVELTFDEEYYESDINYPDSVVEVDGPFEIDGYNALLLHVTPFQYNPKRRQLVGYGKITVSITRKMRTLGSIQPVTVEWLFPARK